METQIFTKENLEVAAQALQQGEICAHDSRLGRGGGPRTPVARALWTAPSPPSAVESGAPPRAARPPRIGRDRGPGSREGRRRETAG